MRVSSFSNIGILVSFIVFMVAIPAAAAPKVDVTVVENDGSRAVVDVALTMPDEGLLAYSFSVMFDGDLTLSSGVRIEPTGMVPLGGFNSGAAGENIITGLSAASAAVVEPVGVGGATFSVATLTFDLGGGGGIVSTGPFFDNVDGFVIHSSDFTLDGEFGGANLELFEFHSASILVPEPGVGVLVVFATCVLAVVGSFHRS